MHDLHAWTAKPSTRVFDVGFAVAAATTEETETTPSHILRILGTGLTERGTVCVQPCSAAMLEFGPHVERCCVAVTTHPLPPDRGQHGCTVGTDRDPPVWAPPPRQGGEGTRAPALACVVASEVVVDCGERASVGH